MLSRFLALPESLLYPIYSWLYTVLPGTGRVSLRNLSRLPRKESSSERSRLPAPTRLFQIHQLHCVDLPPQKPAPQRPKLLYRIGGVELHRRLGRVRRPQRLCHLIRRHLG